MTSKSALPSWLLAAVDHAGDATVILKPGDRPFVVKSNAPYHLGTQPLTTLMMEGLAQQILSEPGHRALSGGNAVEEIVTGAIPVTVKAIRMDHDIVIRVRRATGVAAVSTRPPAAPEPEVDEITRALEEETRVIKARAAEAARLAAEAAAAAPWAPSAVEPEVDEIVQAIEEETRVIKARAAEAARQAAEAPVEEAVASESAAEIDVPLEEAAMDAFLGTDGEVEDAAAREAREQAQRELEERAARANEEAAALRRDLEQEQAARRKLADSVAQAQDDVATARRELAEARRRAEDAATQRKIDQAARREFEEAVRRAHQEAEEARREAARAGYLPREREGSEAAQREQKQLEQRARRAEADAVRSEEHTSELQSQSNLVCRLLLEKKNKPFPNDTLDMFMNAAVDAGLVMHGFITAAESIGLGCCPISLLRDEVEQLSAILGLPAGVFPVAGLCIGHPARESKLSMRLPPEVTVHVDRYDASAFERELAAYDARRAQAEPARPGNQRHADRYGEVSPYTWSEDKARQYSVPQRHSFGDYVRKQGFLLK